MGRFIDRGKALIESMVAGQQVSLSPAEQGLIAGWCWYTTVSMDYAVREVDERTPKLTWLLDHDEPPPGWRAWLGYFNYDMADLVSPATIKRADYGQVYVGKSFSRVMTINRLVIQVLAPDSLPEPFEHPAAARGHLVEIWPSSAGPVKWPPSLRESKFNRVAFDALSHVFVGM